MLPGQARKANTVRIVCQTSEFARGPQTVGSEMRQATTSLTVKLPSWRGSHDAWAIVIALDLAITLTGAERHKEAGGWSRQA